MRRRQPPAGLPFPGGRSFQNAFFRLARERPAAAVAIVAGAVIAVLLYLYVEQRRQLARQEQRDGAPGTTRPAEDPRSPTSRRSRPRVPVLEIKAQPGGGPLAMPAVLRSNHFVYGMPRAADGRFDLRLPDDPPGAPPRAGLSVLVREGFVVGHFDRYKVPAWVMLRWTTDDYDRSEQDTRRHDRHWSPDEELPDYARAGTSYDAQRSKMDRGHMARHEDNQAWGEDNVDMGCRMSNLVPQHHDLNAGPWLALENAHRRVVADPESTGIAAVWVISGPIFDAGGPSATVGNAVGVPHATYKVIGWYDRSGQFLARGYVMKQTDRADAPARADRGEPQVDLRKFLVPVDEIEAATGLDFFPEMPDDQEQAVESERARDVWGW